MHFAFNDEQIALTQSAQKFLSNTCSLSQTMFLMDTERGYNPKTSSENKDIHSYKTNHIAEAYHLRPSHGAGASRFAISVLFPDMDCFHPRNAG